MPWVKIGRYRFDLDDVALVTDVVGGEEREDSPEGKGVTISLKTQLTFDLLGNDAQVFTKAFDEHVSARTIGRGPPLPIIEPRIVTPSRLMVPGSADG